MKDKLKELEEFFTIKPKHIKWLDNKSFIENYNFLYRLLKGCFDIKYNEKKYIWDKSYILDTLLEKGYFTVTDTEMGILPLLCGVHGLNVFSKPNKITVTNPILRSFDRTINVDCSLIKLFDNYSNVVPIISVYAKKLAMCDSAIDLNIFNTKVGFMARVSNKKEADSLKTAFDNIMSGEPLTVISDSLNSDGFQPFFNNVKQNFVANDILETKRQIINEFMERVGINSNPSQMKKERLLVDEINSNNDSIQKCINEWKRNIEDGVNVANALFPDIHLSITINTNKSSLNERKEENNAYEV